MYRIRKQPLGKVAVFLARNIDNSGFNTFMLVTFAGVTELL